MMTTFFMIAAILTLFLILLSENKEKEVTTNAMVLSFMNLGMALGTPILGRIAGAEGYRTIHSVSIFFIVALIILYTFTHGCEKTVN